MTTRFGDLGARLLLLTSLRMETRAVERGVAGWRLRPRVVQIGMGRMHAEQASRRALADGRPELVIALGFAGSLSGELRPGDVFQAVQVCDESGRPTPAPCLVAGPERRVLLASVAEPAATAECKSLLHAATGASAVDMESLAVAQVCAAAGVPFAVLRAISDSYDEDLPPEVLGWTDERGEIRTGRTIRSLAMRPSLLPRVVALARNAGLAARGLTRKVRELGVAEIPW